MIWHDEPGKVVLLGQAPSRDTDGGEPFSGRSGRRIAELMGIEHHELGKRFALANVFDRWPGPSGRGKGDAFPVKRARTLACAMRQGLRGRRVVAFGSQVARILIHDDRGEEWILPFGDCDWPQLMNDEKPELLLALVPHPSGVNRWWNERDNVARAQRFLRSLVVG